MVNAAKIRSPMIGWCAVMLLAAVVLTAAAWLRSAEYDEQYTLFLTAGTPRPEWPETVFLAGDVAAVQAGHSSLAQIARDLRATDVHPPLYFWAVAVWRDLFGPSLLAARLLSVLCGLGSLGLVGVIARRCAIMPALAMLLTLGCYGFVYTNSIARGFAPAQLLTLGGVVLLLQKRAVMAGVCLGAACCCNYLAVFAATAAILAVAAWPAVLSAIPFLALDSWFFAAQHAARPDQFPPFELWQSLLRIAEFQTAAVFGGLPLYADGIARVALEAVVGLLATGLVVCIAFSRPLKTAPVRLLLAAASAPAIGLLALGATFNNTPIELRYLSFGLPFLALLAARTARKLPSEQSRHGFRKHRATGSVQHGQLQSLRLRPTPQECPCRPRPGDHARTISSIWMGRTWSGGGATTQRPIVASKVPKILRLTLPLMLITQLAAIMGLLFAPRTMQPARAAAADAARLAGQGIVLLPRGNDGVGIAGAFAIQAPANLPLLLVRPNDLIASAIAPYHRVVLALLAQDRDSIAAIPTLRAAFASPNWRRVAIGSNLEVYERTETRE